MEEDEDGKRRGTLRGRRNMLIKGMIRGRSGKRKGACIRRREEFEMMG